MSKNQTLGITDDQDKLLSEALKQVEKSSFEMKTCLDNDKLMDALKHASSMLSELRTSLLSPKSYYELYMSISDQLRHLEQFLLDEFEKGKKMSDLYELVQYAGNIVPRLYLLVTVGTVYVKAKEGSRKDILRDLVEMCRGVQHPLRGLFLRNYLLQCTRNLLPDSNEDLDGTVNDSITFIQHNFSEMNKLWVRMQHQGHTKEKDRREKERLELRILVGTNLVRLSQLETIDARLYEKSVLPSVLEQVVKCRDAIAQEYLMECIIQVFPDEYHLVSLNPYLKTCADLQEFVNVKSIVIALIDRLAAFAHRSDISAIPDNIKLFDIFQQEIAIIISSRPNMEMEDIVSLHVSLVNLAIKCYSDNLDYVDKALLATSEHMSKKEISSVQSNSSTGRELQHLMKVPIDNYEDVLTVLKLQNYSLLLKCFDFDGRKALALYVLQAVLDKNVYVTSLKEVNALLELISPLITDQNDQPDEIPDPEDFAEEQGMVARLIHLFKAPVPDQQYEIIKSSKKEFVSGGNTRVIHTLTPIVFSSFRLIVAYQNMQKSDSKWFAKCERIFQISLQTISELCKLVPEVSLRLYLQGALAADSIGNETIAYEFLTQAFTLYEEDISDSREQVVCLTLIMGTFENMSSLEEENHEAVRTKCAVASSRLLKKPDQCRCVATCAHLFWSAKVSDEGTSNECLDSKRVMECLKKSGRIANQCMDDVVKVQLLVELLNVYILFNEKGNKEITKQFLKQLVDKIKGDTESMDKNDETEQVMQHFENSLTHLRHLKQSGDEVQT